jgi:beta-lysine 5,6-aminomutase alpha subunit
MDCYLSLKSAKYVFGTARHLGDEFEWKPDGRVATRAKEVLGKTHELLVDVERRGIWDSIGQGVFGDIKRTRTGGKGYHGVVKREPGYVNPLLEILEGSTNGGAR